MRFNFYSHGEFGTQWDHRTPHTTGCGGSETSHIALSSRLASLGHAVYSYAPIPSDCPPDPSGVIWRPENELLSAEFGVWVINRCPAVIAEIPESLGPVWLVCHDIAYQDFGEEWMKRVTRVLALGTDHYAFLKRLYPSIAHKIHLSGNGIEGELIGEQPIPIRNPHSCVFASAPERGLLQALEIHSRVREIIPDAELHVYFGFQNFDENFDAARFAQIIGEVSEAKRRVETDPGVIFCGRVPKVDLYQGWLSSSIWLHPTVFLETNCITAQEAQACGAIPVTNLIWGIKDNVRYGVGIEGDPRNCDLTRARYVQAVASLMLDEERQEEIRIPMMTWALSHFDWSNRVEEWEGWGYEDYATALNGMPVSEIRIEREFFVTQEMVEA